MLPLTHKDKLYSPSVLQTVRERLSGWLRLVFSDTNSRNLFFFLLLNLSFAFVELFYGLATNSLGLISDSFHMFFDCTGLLAGLAASVITRWRANERFTYGYVRAEVLAGFMNGLFLLFIAFFIFSEAVERAVEPPEVKHERLFVVSVLGLLVNLVGVFVFQHGGHGHSHGGGHGHSHGGGHGHSHGGGHGHSHGGGGHGHSHGSSPDSSLPVHGSDAQIMRGVFLHILADTLGSVGVIISAVLMSQFGWMIADPICSMFIAATIGISTLSLLRESVAVLMQRTPRQLDSALAACFVRAAQIDGVLSVQQPHFWTLCSDVYVGTVKLEVTPHADPRHVLSRAQMLFSAAGVHQVVIQLDYAAV